MPNKVTRIVSKQHYPLLDGLRGVAALIVVCFHVSEAFATSHLDYMVGHGYLAVDFFFILSGFVIGYAYDDRWGSLRLGGFAKRRLFRLHPMVIFGTLLGACLFYTQDCEFCPVNEVPVSILLLAVLMGMFMVPMTPSMDIRGFQEMYPLNGPAWSLLFEYLGNLLYAVALRRMSDRQLSVVVLVAGITLASMAIGGETGDVCFGFMLTQYEFVGGFLRMLFSFSVGLLLSRRFSGQVKKGVFWLETMVLVVLLSFPRIGGTENIWMNGIYESLCILIIFPCMVYLGACGQISGKVTNALCSFFGKISYPLYLVHYPYLYCYYAWVKNGNLGFEQSLWGATLLVAGSVLTAWLCYKLYETPIRRYLSRYLQ